MTIVLHDQNPLYELYDAVYRQQSEFSNKTDASIIRHAIQTRLDPAQFELVLGGMPQEMQDYVTLKYITKPRRSMLDIATLMGLTNTELSLLSVRVIRYLSHPATKRRFERLPVSVFEEIDARCAEAERFAADNERLYAVLHHLLSGHITPDRLTLRDVAPVDRERYAEETPIEFIDFRYGDYNTLRRNDIETVEDMLRLGGNGLLQRHNIGATVLTRLTEKLAEHRFTLTDEPQAIPARYRAVLATAVRDMQTVADIDDQVQRAQEDPHATVTVDVYPRFIDTWAGVLTLTGRK